MCGTGHGDVCQGLDCMMQAMEEVELMPVFNIYLLQDLEIPIICSVCRDQDVKLTYLWLKK